MKRILFHTLVFCLILVTFSQCSKSGGNQSNSSGAITRILTEEEVRSLISVGMDTLDIENMIKAVKNNEYPNLHSVLIVKNKKLVIERYFSGKDENFGSNLGIVNHSAGTLHDIRSISKSITSACIGIAFSQGLFTNVDQNVFDFFPEYISYKTGLRAGLTIKHLLTMSAGMEWDENLPYTDPKNSEIQLTNAADPVEFVLSRPMIATPGHFFNYNGGLTHLLAAIVKKVSGKEVDQFAAENLFAPIGIKSFHWNKYSRSNQPAAASGLRLTSGDLMKIGLLYQNDGIWMNTQILPVAWVHESHSVQINRPVGAYGYQFFVLPSFTISSRQMTLTAALGNGDQRIFFDKLNDLVVVVTAGNYNQTLQKNALSLTKDFIYPAIF